MKAKRLYRAVALLAAWMCGLAAVACVAGKPEVLPSLAWPMPADTAVAMPETVDTLLPVAPVDTLRIPKSRLRRERGNIVLADSAAMAGDSILLSVDSADVAYADSLQRAMEDSLQLARFNEWRPDPIRAMWLGMVIPGGGQIYNRKYWKLPLFYGGFLGCIYAVSWNGQMLRDYSQAYQDIMDNDPTTNSYLEMLPLGYDITGREEHFKSVFKRKKDYYRRYRDLSIFCIAGVYLLSIIDAYVDAELSTFDIGRDLSLNVAPTVIPSGTQQGPSPLGGSPGITLQLTY